MKKISGWLYIILGIVLAIFLPLVAISNLVLSSYALLTTVALVWVIGSPLLIIIGIIKLIKGRKRKVKKEVKRKTSKKKK
jgi:nitrate reductase gamma subunit